MQKVRHIFMTALDIQFQILFHLTFRCSFHPSLTVLYTIDQLPLLDLVRGRTFF